MKLTWLIMAGIAVAAALSGCTAELPPEPTAVATSAAPAPAPMPTTADGVVGEGDLQSVGRAASGHLDIVKDDTYFRLTWSDIEVDYDLANHGLMGIFVDGPIENIECGEDFSGYPAMEYRPDIPENVYKFTELQLSDDPSFITAIALVTYPDIAAEGCDEEIVALIPIHWSVPDMRPELVAVDSGSTGGAHGVVELENGKPAVYRTEYGDVWAEIAARFGMSSDDLQWLNPLAHPLSRKNEAVYGEELNLDRAHRGERDSRQSAHP